MIRVEVATVSIMKEELDASVLEKQLCDILRSDLQIQYQSLHTPSIIGRFMLQRMLLDAGIEKKEFELLQKSKYGKWILKGSTLDFNISHCSDKVVVALTNQGCIGIDIEKYRAVEWREYESCFTHSEWNQILDSPDSAISFFNLWTKKESFVKALGAGLQIPLQSVIINNAKDTILYNEVKGFFSTLNISGYSCHACTTLPSNEIYVEEFYF